MNPTSTNWKVEDPSVTLYAFHLRHDITKVKPEVMDGADALWEQCVTFGEQHDIPVLKSLKTQLRSYTEDKNSGEWKYTPANEEGEATEAEKPNLDDKLELVRKNPEPDKARSLDFKSDTQENGFSLMGEICPLRIHDTYAIDLTLRYCTTVPIEQLSQLNPIQQIQGSIGQTLLLFAKPVNVSTLDYQDFASECVAALLKERPENLKPSAVGQIFGSPIFEYDNDYSNPKQRRHILVWLNSDPQTLDLINREYYTILNLLCCRSKILYAYHKSRGCEVKAYQIYNNLEKQIKTLAETSPQTLAERKEWLKQMPLMMLEYNQWLRDLQDHQSAIVTNTHNYRTRLETLEKASLTADNLRFLQNFLNLTCKQFQNQISVDLRYLTPAQGLFQQMIDTIRGVVEIEAEEQAQVRNENLQINIAAVGAGVGVAGVVASSFQYLIKPEPEKQKIILQPPFISGSLHPFFLVIIASIIAGLLFVFIISKIASIVVVQKKDG